MTENQQGFQHPLGATASDINSGPNPDAPSIAPPDDGFIPVTRPSLQQQVASKTRTVGISVTRVKVGDSAFSTKDLQMLVHSIAKVDPNAIFLNHSKNPGSAKPIAEMATKALRMEYNGAMDVQTYTWSHPRDNKKKTSLCFYLATDAISMNLKELKQDPIIREFCQLSKCSLQPTNLQQSQSKVISLFEGKDPRHTNRPDLGDRISQHLKFYNDKAVEIPVNIVPLTVEGIRILGFSVGINDSQKAISILEKYPFEELELIHQSWKKTSPDVYTRRIRQHQAVCDSSTAFKLQNMDPIDGVALLKQHVEHNSLQEIIVDVSPAVHASTTGVVYVQFLRPHRVQALLHLHEFLAGYTNVIDGPFGQQIPHIVNEDDSLAPTKTSSDTKGTDTPKPPPLGRFASVPLGMQVPAGPTVPSTHRNAWLPTRLAKPKSYCTALSGDISSDSDSDDAATIRTSNSKEDSTISSKTGKTARELELEEENAKLKQQLQFQLEKHTYEMDQLKQEFQAQMQAFHLKSQQKDEDFDNFKVHVERQFAELQHHQANHPPTGSPPRNANSKRHKPGTPTDKPGTHTDKPPPADHDQHQSHLVRGITTGLRYLSPFNPDGTMDTSDEDQHTQSSSMGEEAIHHV